MVGVIKRHIRRFSRITIGRLHARDPEDFPSLILYTGGVLLTLAILGGAYAVARFGLQAYVAQQAARFDAQADAVNHIFHRMGGVYNRSAEFYAALQAAETRHRDAFHDGRAYDQGVGYLAPDCPMNLYVAAPVGDPPDLACSSPLSRIALDWIHRCPNCLREGTMIFDVAGRYLAVMRDERQPVQYAAATVIGQKTQAARAALAAARERGSRGDGGIWLAPRFDAREQGHVVDYVKAFRLPNGAPTVLVRPAVLEDFVKEVMSIETLQSTALVHPDGIVDFSQGQPGAAPREPARAGLRPAAGDRRTILWRDFALDLRRQGPAPDWVWVNRVDRTQVLGDLWRPALDLGAGFAGLLAALWAMIVWFDLRILAPVKRRARRGRDSAAFEQTMANSLRIGFAAFHPSTRRFVIRNTLAGELFDAQANQAALAGLFERAAAHDFEAEPRLAVDLELDGQAGPRHYEFALRATRYGDAEIVLLAIYDVSSRHQTEALLQDAKLSAEAANRAKGDFLAIMSHEIRTPLHGALSNLELISLDADDPDLRKRVDIVSRGFTSLMALLDNALDFSKLDAQLFRPKRSSFSLRGLVEQVLLSARPSVGAHPVRINYAVADLGAQAIGDEHLLRQVILNLLHNALKFTHRGRVGVQCRRGGGLEGGECLTIEVADTGEGIPAEDLDRIFAPYVQSPSSRNAMVRGTGLGLALCAKICELLGGRIEVRSELRAGTTFTLRLPIDWERQPARAYDWPVSDGRKVFVLLEREDAPNDLVEVLRAAGWQVEVGAAAALSAAAAREPFALRVLMARELAAIRHAAPVDLVVADDGPLRPDCRGDRYVVSSYSLDAIRAAWQVLLGEFGQAAADDVPRLLAREDLHEARVLVIDDDAVCRQLLRRQLAVLGIEQVDEAADGDAALAWAGAARHALILTDLNMPRLDGPRLIEALARAAVDTPIILTTADVSWERTLGAAGERLADVLMKPWSLDALRDALAFVFPVAEPPAEAREGRLDEALASMLATGLPRDWTAARDAFAAGDRQQLRRALHKMAGSLLFFSQDPLGQALQALSRRCLEMPVETLSAELAALEPMVDAAIARHAGRGGDPLRRN
ncbi:hybrid sensor histidine kinase/response regulator [Burkholderia gladioli]|uniref:hybrid sensor histidine kinase/response regulator n=1 Tax=Burkholderia gladioli TaxID=28095 RepID=UPI001640FC47|nr:hybrid sensor histidine kinase/response regulator [Burkholderia gladioli]